MELNFLSLWAMLAVGLAWVWVTFGQWMLAKKSIETLGRNPTMYSYLLIYTSLWLALVESAAIYSLVIAFQIFASPWLDPLSAISAWLVMGLTGFWVGIAEWWYLKFCIDAMNRNPENISQVVQFMILFVALLESVAIYGMIIAFKIIG